MATPMPPPPEQPLEYPIRLSKDKHPSEDGEDSAGLGDDVESGVVSLFTALSWLLPVYEHAGWIPRAAPSAAAADGEDASAPFPEVRRARALLPRFRAFFDIAGELVPGRAALNHVVRALVVPTPRGPRRVTRAGVEGDARGAYAAGRGLRTVTNTTAVFSLLPGHNHFLVHYEAAARLGRCTYLELDQLRFAWVAVRGLLTDGGVLGRGGLTGLARRDLRRNTPPWDPALLTAMTQTPATKPPTPTPTPATGTVTQGKGVVGRGGGNARLHQGTSGNVITDAVPRAALAERREMREKRFVRDDLLGDAARRWPHTPPAKSCRFVVEERSAGELGPEELRAAGVVVGNARNRAGGSWRGPKLFRAAVELPLLNKKGGVARFTADRWWLSRGEAENAAAEVALLALRSMKSNSAS